MRPRLAAAALAVAAIACTPGQGPAGPAAGPAPPASAPAATAAPPPAGCGDPARSLRPAEPAPEPGAMPAGSFLRTIQDRGRLVAGVSGDRQLLGSLNPLSNRVEGFEIDLLRAVSAAIFGDEDHLQLRVIAEAEAAPLLQRGAVDVVAHALTITCEARRQVDFSTEYYHAEQRVLVARNSPVRGIQDLRGKHVCAAAGSPELANVAAAASRPIPLAAPDWSECMVLFQQGGADAVSAGDATLLGFTVQDPYARIAGAPLADEPYGVATALDHPDLVRLLNAVLERLRAGGGWTALYDRWLGRLGPAPAPPTARYRD